MTSGPLGSEGDAGSVDVYYLTPSAFGGYEPFLTSHLGPIDRVRADDLRGTPRWAAFVVAHAAVELLVVRSAARTGQVHLRYECPEHGPGDHGRPRLFHGSVPASGDVSLSYSDDIVVVATSSAGDIGVDVEALRPVPESTRLAARFFDEGEKAWITTQPDPSAALLRCWARSEAYVKAIGLGLNHPFSSFSIDGAPGGPMIVESNRDLDPPILDTGILMGPLRRSSSWHVLPVPP